MRPVGVHLDHELGAVFQPHSERVLIGTPEPQLARTMQDSHRAIGTSKAIGQIAGAVRRCVVDDEDVVPELADTRNDALQVLNLVVGGQNHQNPIGHFPNRTLRTWRNMSSELRTALTLVGAELRHTTGTSAMRIPFFLAR